MEHRKKNPEKLSGICKNVLHLMLVGSFKRASAHQYMDLIQYMNTAPLFLESVGQQLISTGMHDLGPLKLFSPFLRHLSITSDDIEYLKRDKELRWSALTSLEVLPENPFYVEVSRYFLNSTFPDFVRSVCSASLSHITLHFCTDKILLRLVHFCPNLQSLNFCMDEVKSLSDVALTAATRCQRLHTFRLNAQGHEFDDEDRYKNLSEIGVSNLISLLPRLQHLEVEPHLLRKAVYRLETDLGGGIRFPLKRFTVMENWSRLNSDEDAEFILKILNIFPELNTLEFVRPDMIHLHTLGASKHGIKMLLIREMSLSDYSWIQGVGSNLSSLEILFCGMKESLLEAVNHACPQLQNLEIIFARRLADVGRPPAKVVPMNKLENLTLRGDFTAASLYQFIGNASLVSVTLEPALDDVITNHVIRRVFKNGALYSKLQCLRLIRCYTDLDMAALFFIVAQCQNLRKLGNLHNSHPQFCNGLQKVIKENNWDLELI